MTDLAVEIGPDGGDSLFVAHGLTDLAAALAVRTWEQSPIGVAMGEMWGGLDSALQPAARATARGLTTWDAAAALRGTVLDAAEAGARLGFALALTADQAANGWPAWLAAAARTLASGGCGPGAHEGPQVEGLRRLAHELEGRPSAAGGTR